MNNIYHRAKRDDPCFFHALILKNRHPEHFRNEKAVFKLRDIRSPSKSLSVFFHYFLGIPTDQSLLQQRDLRRDEKRCDKSELHGQRLKMLRVKAIKSA
jgi:hypothetical protein